MGLFDIFRSKSRKTSSITEQGLGLVARESGKAFTTPETVMPTRPDDYPKNWLLYEQYRNAYLNFPLVRAAIDITTEQVVQEIHFETTREDNKDDEWIKRMENFADKFNLQSWFRRICKQLLIFGDAFVEVVKLLNKGIKELKILNPQTMEIVRDPYGDVICYVQVVGAKKICWGNPPKEGIYANAEKVGDVDDIVNFKFDVIGSEKWGTSIIHSVLPMLRIKEVIENNLKTIVEKYAVPMLDFSIGDENHPPTQQDIEDFKNAIKNINSETELVHSYLVKVQTIGFERKALNLEPIIEHIENQVITGLQVPAVLLGRSANIDRAVAEVQLRTFTRHVKAIQRILKEMFEDKIMYKHIGCPKTVKLVWGTVEEREAEANIDMIRGLVKDGIITPQKANSLLPRRYHEKLPENPVKKARPSQSKAPDTIKDNPTDPTKTTQLSDDGKRQNRTDVAVPMDEETRKKTKQSLK